MADYKRLVSYMYNYENGFKGNNVGYARVESISGQCKVTIRIQVANINNEELRVFFFKRDGYSIEGILLGKVSVKNGRGQFRTITDSNNIMASSYKLDDIGGLILYHSDKRYIASEWDDKPITKEMVNESLLIPRKPEIHYEEALKASNNKEEKEDKKLIKMADNKEEKAISFEEDSEEERSVSLEEDSEEERSVSLEEDSKEEEKIMSLEEESVLPEEDSEEEKLVSIEEEKTEKEEPISLEEDLLEEVDEPASEIHIKAAKTVYAHKTKENPKESNSNKEDDKSAKITEAAKTLNPYQSNSNMSNQAPYSQKKRKPWPSFEENTEALRIYNKYPRMYPFEDNEVAWCVRFEPQDIGILPMENWQLGNNSFLLHGFYCYSHLIFARINDKTGIQYVLGVPGIYHNREKFMAKTFGFDHFKSIKRKEHRTGEFGYWYTPIIFN